MAVKLKNYIDGKWVEPLSGKYGESTNPADVSDVVARYPLSNDMDVNLAVEASRKALQSWRLTPAPKRGEILFRAAEMLRDRKDDLGRLVTREMGKVLSEGMGDIQEAVDLGYFMAGEGRRLLSEVAPSELPDKDCKTIRVPHGVFALITPWNFPVAIPAWKIFSALICGNTAVFKPSSETPLCAVRLVEICEQAGLPPGVLNLVMGDGAVVGETLALHPGTDGISFTGSCVIGEYLEVKAAELHRPIAAEMGGKNAILVMDDADLDLALEGVLWGAFGTTGQRCTASSRVVVHNEIHDQFLERLVGAVRRLKLGNGLEEGVDVGPLINGKGVSKVLNYIRIGQEEGAHIHTGGAQMVEGSFKKGFFIEPTVFSHVTQEMRIAQEEIFGPVVAVMRCSSFEEGVEIVNSTRVGLSASIYTRDVNRSARAEREIETGLVYINASTIGAEIQLPFGGYKHSGSGHPEVGGRMGGIDFYSRIKTIYRDFSGRIQKAQIAET